MFVWKCLSIFNEARRGLKVLEVLIIHFSPTFDANFLSTELRCNVKLFYEKIYSEPQILNFEKNN